jgi:hypothetical protein
MTRATAVILALLTGACASAPASAQIEQPPTTPQATPPPPAAPPPAATTAGMPPPAPAPPVMEDPGVTAGGALAAFMAARDYRSIRALKALMTPALAARYDHDSAPFNGKRNIRIAAFDFSERDLRPVKGTKGAYAATVRTLWEEQGEAVERRVETIGLTQQPNGVWRVSSLERSTSEYLRYNDAVNGVTTLRLVLRAWRKGDVAAARPYFSAAFAKRYQGRDDALNALFGIAGPAVSAAATGAPEGPGPAAAASGPPPAAFEIVELTPKGDAAAVAQVRLYRGTRDRPSPFDSSEHILHMVRVGPRWLLDAWD